MTFDNAYALSVLPIGPEDAKIMLIGEAPGENEVKQGVPFVGMAGRALDGLLQEVGLVRSQLRITNVMKTRPVGNKFANFYEKVKGKKQPTGELLRGIEQLREEIVACQPNVIVPMGGEALKAVTGLTGILDWRGSVINTPLGKVIPTIHPAALLRQWNYRPAVVADFNKIVKESVDAKYEPTKRDLTINPTYKEVMQAIKEAKQAEACAFDIETESDQITCIGLSYGLHRAICIPFWFGASGSFWREEEEEEIWKELKCLLEAESPKKIAHNGMYDIEYIKRTTGIEPKLHFDTMLGFHALYLELPKSLAFLVSLYTDHPFYKYQRKTSDMDTYWLYNATDAALTYECGMVIRQDLATNNLMGFYTNYINSLVSPLLGMSEKGVRFDHAKCKELRKEYRRRIEESQQSLTNLAGHELNTASHKQMIEWLYAELKLPKKYKLRKTTGQKTLGADTETLQWHLKTCKDEKIKQMLTIILDIRAKNKILSTYLSVKLDKDKRIRCSYMITGTETGRLSSRATARGTGTNLQNIPNGVFKNLFCADEGMTLVEADLSQAEARVVAYISGEQRLIDVFESGGDVHTRNASNIFNCSLDAVTPEQRQTAKRVVHASNYGMGPRTFAKTAGVSESDAKRLLNQYFATYPRIRYWHTQLKSELQRVRKLVTPFGRVRYFFNKWDDSMFKEGLAYIPQSTVADVVNQGLVELYEYSEKWYDVLLQVHDSILVQCPEAYVDRTIKHMKKVMSRPIEIQGKILTIPVDVKVGYAWGTMEKWSEKGVLV